jgi:hypothetical protein
LKELSEISFPVYRQYKNGLSWFRFESADHFTEVRKIGSKYISSVHEAMILPDRNFIHDLVLDYEAFAVEIQAKEFEKVFDLASK